MPVGGDVAARDMHGGGGPQCWDSDVWEPCRSWEVHHEVLDGLAAPALRPAPGITYMQNPSAFVNYSLNWRDFARFARIAYGAFIRGDTTLTLDERDRLRRWVIGARFIGTGLLGGGPHHPRGTA